jgi:hypothetical protein
MTYNTSRGEITIPEYGRNIQLLIEHAKTIEDAAYRQAYIEEIVNLMQQLYPQARNVEDYIAKLWSHVFRIANYDLDVVPPCEISHKEDVYKRPEMIPYPVKEVKMRHYGKNVQQMVEKAINTEDPLIRAEYVEVIAAYMKLSYTTWNGENVSDEIIKKDLATLSDGKLSLEKGADIDDLMQVGSAERRRSNAAAASPVRSSSSRKPPISSSRTSSSSPRSSSPRSSSSSRPPASRPPIKNTPPNSRWKK